MAEKIPEKNPMEMMKQLIAEKKKKSSEQGFWKKKKDGKRPPGREKVRIQQRPGTPLRFPAHPPPGAPPLSCPFLRCEKFIKYLLPP